MEGAYVIKGQHPCSEFAVLGPARSKVGPDSTPGQSSQGTLQIRSQRVTLSRCGSCESKAGELLTAALVY